MKSWLYKLLVGGSAIGIVASVYLFGSTILTMIITPLPKGLQTCLNEKLGSDVSAQEACSSIPVEATDSVAVWTTDRKLRESKVYVKGTWPNQNVGLGTTAPGSLLDVSTTGSTLGGTAHSAALRVNAGALGGTLGNEVVLGSIGGTTTNSTALGIRLYRATAGTSWTTSALLLEMDVDSTPRVNSAYIALNANGNVGLSTVTPADKLEVNGNILLQNTGRIRAKETDGTVREVLYGRWSDNATYLDGGAGGLNLRVNNAGTTKTAINANADAVLTASQGTIYFPTNNTWTGDAGANQGKIQYHADRFYINAGSASNRIVQFRRSGSDVSYIDNAGEFIGNALYANRWWTESHKGTYYMTSNWTGSYWRLASTYSTTPHVSVQHATTADTLNGRTFNWSGQAGQPSWLWGGSDGTNMYVYNPSNFNVASVGGYGAASLLKWNTWDNGNYFQTNGNIYMAWASGWMSDILAAKANLSSARFGGYGNGNSNIAAYSMEIGGPGPTATNGQATIYFHHHGAVAHQLRYSSGTFYFERAGNGYGTNNTPTIWVGGSVNQNMGSDIRYKKNVTQISNAFDTLKKFNGVTYQWTDAKQMGIDEEPDKTHMGFIAQEVQKIFPDWVYINEDGKYFIKGNSDTTLGFNALIVQALKEFEATVNTFKQEITEKITALSVRQDKQEDQLQQQQLLIEKQQKQIDELSKKIDELSQK